MKRELMCLASLAVLAFGQNVDVRCGSSTCGEGAHCTQESLTPVCSCLPGYSGDPLSGCARITCVDSRQCGENQVCFNQRCVNPCEGLCGDNATCEVRRRNPDCSCRPGYTGNPYVSCSEIDFGNF